MLQMAHKSHFCFFLVIIFGVPYPTDSTERFLHVDQKRKYCYESFWKKKDGNIHGVGIESVEKVAEKYDGWVSTSWGNKSFRTMLVLNNSYVV